jgi:DNA-binding beta-propeller fold protein YncE
MTGWTSPLGAAVDAKHKRIFVLDTTMAPSGKPDPNWSRIAMYDFDGKYLGDINRYDGNARTKDDSRRTWYDDIAVDPARQRVYVTANRFQQILAFDYHGKQAGNVRAPGSGALAVFPDGRIARGSGRTIQLYEPDLKPGFAARGNLEVP